MTTKQSAVGQNQHEDGVPKKKSAGNRSHDVAARRPMYQPLDYGSTVGLQLGFALRILRTNETMPVVMARTRWPSTKWGGEGVGGRQLKKM